MRPVRRQIALAFASLAIAFTASPVIAHTQARSGILQATNDFPVSPPARTDSRLFYLSVPENRSDPESRLIELPIAVLPSQEQAGDSFSASVDETIAPVIMLTGPGPAAKKALEKAGLKREDIDLWEINEAFASVALRYMRDLDIDHEVTNVNGGAIAMGHPLGATGAMLVSTVLDELERRDLKRAMLSLCVGGGMGISTIIERV